MIAVTWSAETKPSNVIIRCTAMQSQKVVSAYFSSKQILPIGLHGRIPDNNVTGFR